MVVVQIIKLLLQLFFPCSYFCTSVLHMGTEALPMVCSVHISNKLIVLVPRRWLLSVRSMKHRSTKKPYQKFCIQQTFPFPLSWTIFSSLRYCFLPYFYSLSSWKSKILISIFPFEKENGMCCPLEIVNLSLLQNWYNTLLSSRNTCCSILDFSIWHSKSGRSTGFLKHIHVCSTYTYA